MAVQDAHAVEAMTWTNLMNPTVTVDNRYSYFPGTEPLGKDEIRIVACGKAWASSRLFSGRTWKRG